MTTTWPLHVRQTFFFWIDANGCDSCTTNEKWMSTFTCPILDFLCIFSPFSRIITIINIYAGRFVYLTQRLRNGSAENRHKEFVRVRRKWWDTSGAGAMSFRFLHSRITSTGRSRQSPIRAYAGPWEFATAKNGNWSSVGEIAGVLSHTLRYGWGSNWRPLRCYNLLFRLEQACTEPYHRWTISLFTKDSSINRKHKTERHRSMMSRHCISRPGKLNWFYAHRNSSPQITHININQ